MRLATVILAAGKGTRMKSRIAKVLHPVAGRPLIDYPVVLAQALGASRIVCVLGHQAAEVAAAITARFGPGSVETALQEEQRGTGHAVAQAAPLLRSFEGQILILYGDTPALTEDTLRRLVAASQGQTLAMVTARMADPRGYGRVIRDASGRVQGVVEDRDCRPAEREIREINAGIYCVRADFLFPALADIRPENAQGELYLTDVVARAAAVSAVATVEASEEEVMGVNDRVDLERADRTLRRRVAENLMRSGVTIHLPETCRIDAGVSVGPDSEIGPLVVLAGKTRVGTGVVIDQGSILVDAQVADGAHIKPYSVISESEVGPEAQVGPFSHLRPGSQLGAHVRVGNFVETKKARLGEGAKASHLSYLGDAEIGREVNIGCGTITCNYDGYEKFRTVIEDGAFIGSDTQLVAPVRVGAGAFVGAGTTVTEDVPPGALALTRAPQRAIEGYADRKRQAREAQAEETKQHPPGEAPVRAGKGG